MRDVAIVRDVRESIPEDGGGVAVDLGESDAHRMPQSSCWLTVHPGLSHAGCIRCFRFAFDCRK